MLRLPFLLILLLLSMANTIAQGSTLFPIVERCITAPTEPPDDWTFDGTIITFRQGDGVHGFRADTPSRYYIAFDTETEFSRVGALSPDGKWFVSFLGRAVVIGKMPMNIEYVIDNIRVVSTSPNRKTYIVPFLSYAYRLVERFKPVLWLNSTTFAAHEMLGGSLREGWYVVNPFSGTFEQANDEQYDIFENIYFNAGFSYEKNGTLSFAQPIYDTTAPVFVKDFQLGQIGTLHITDPIAQQTYNTCIKTNQAFAVSPTGEQVAVSIGGDDGFVYILDIADWKAYRLDLAANSVIAWVED